MVSFLTRTRSITDVPKTVLIILVLGLILQCVWHATQWSPQAEKETLPHAPSSAMTELFSLGDRIPAAGIVMLWLQAFDTQTGVSLSLKELDYKRVTDWLSLVLKLNERSLYPLLAAARFYAEVPDPARQRIMIRFVMEKFLEKPDIRWPSMAHAVYVAKHRLKDLQLAVECARLLRIHATGENVPYWAKQMEFFVLEDMGELEAAKILIGALLESGELEDKQQQRFLNSRLEQLEEQLKQQNQ